MDAVNRRKRISEIINNSESPVTGSELAGLLNVTRQVVVQDIALLRAGGMPIIATPSGYIKVDAITKTRSLKVFTCRHETLEQAENELMIIVTGGGKIRDVIIEHPIYGEISGSLMLNTPEAVKNLIERLRRKDSMMLSSITNGIHMHTVEAPGEEAFDGIESELRSAGILL